MEIIHLTDISSTNDYLLSLKSQEDIVAVSDYQTHGKGMGTNRWESEPGKNLLFSILIHPTWIPVNQQYLLSMAEAIALCDTLRELTDDITIKWPNDIYWKEKKISGTRIDVNLSGGILTDMVIGTGINVNQTEFLSDAPNPVSLKQITEKDYDRDALLNDILERFQPLQLMLKDGGTEEIVRLYHERLYRKEGMHGYKDANGTFMAAIDYVEPSGILHLTLEDGTKREYMFKEVATN